MCDDDDDDDDDDDGLKTDKINVTPRPIMPGQNVTLVPCSR